MAVSDLNLKEFQEQKIEGESDDSPYLRNIRYTPLSCVYNIVKINSIIFTIAFDGTLFPDNNAKEYTSNSFKYSPMSPLNSMSITGEINEVKASMSTKSLGNVFKLITDLIKITNDTGNDNNLENHNLSLANKPSNHVIVSIEEHILNKVKKHFKKLKIIIHNPEILVRSDDYLLTCLGIKSELFSIRIKNDINKYVDNKIATILSTSNEIKFHDLSLFSRSDTQKEIPIAKLPLFTIHLVDTIKYDFQLKSCDFCTNLVSELPQIGKISMSTENLEKILEIVMSIINGMDMIDYMIALKEIRGRNKKQVEKYSRSAEMEFRYNSMELCIFNEDLLAELNKVNLELTIKEKNHVKKSKEISIKFSPMLLSFSNRSQSKSGDINSVSNLILNEFSLSIKDDVTLIEEAENKIKSPSVVYPNKIKNSEIKINFPCSNIVLYDDHLIYIIQFVSSFLTPILEKDIKKKYKSLLGRNKNAKKFYKEKREKIELNFTKAKITNYVDHEDIFSLSFVNMKMVIDKFLEIPKMKLYHQSNATAHANSQSQNQRKTYSYGKTKIIELDSLKIKFDSVYELNPNAKKIDIVFKNSYVNVYCMEMLTTLIKFSNFYIFFPEWVNFHFQDKYLVDSNTNMDKYPMEYYKREKVLIIFENILVEIKDGNIFQCGILHADYNKLEECKNDKKRIKYLSEVKNSLLTMKVTNFVIEVNNLKESRLERRETIDIKNFYSMSRGEILPINAFNSHSYSTITHNQRVFSTNSYSNSDCNSRNPYYKTIARKSDTELRFEEIEITHADYKLFGLRDFYINIKHDILFKNFVKEKFHDNLVFYRHHHLYSKEVKFDQSKDSKVNIMLKDVMLNFHDVKIFDDTMSFAYKVVNALENFELHRQRMYDYSNISLYETSSNLNIHITNLEGSINSLDPATKTVYNKLILKIYYAGINFDKNSREEFDMTEVCVYFMSFGFDPSQKQGYPLLTIPIAEVNMDNLRNKIIINIPSANKNEMVMKNLHKKMRDNSSKSLSYSEINRPELENLLVETRSITLFVNFKYLSTFVKIFEIFWEKTKFLRKSFENSGSPGSAAPASETTGRLDTRSKYRENFNERDKNFNLDTNQLNSKRKLGHLAITEANFSSTGSSHSEYATSARTSANQKCISSAKIKNVLSSSAQKYNVSNIIPSNNSLNKNLPIIIYNSSIQNQANNLLSSNNTNKLIIGPNTKQCDGVKTKTGKSIFLSLFDLKIVYLLEYKDSYESTFKFHPDIKKQGYFGCILRFYSFSLKYNLKADKQITSLKMDTSLFTVSFLTFENFDDDIFFQNDREIYLCKFHNLKHTKNFNEFMGLPETNKSRFINASTRSFLEYESKSVINTQADNKPKQHTDLLYDNKHTLLKVSTVSFKRKSELNANVEDIWIQVENLKITWNKFNKDVVQLLIFEDVLLIVDKIILKADLKKKGKEKEKITFLDLGRFNFNFKIYNPQIAIQNEIKKSTMLLMNKEPCQVIISKLCVDETSKDFNLEVINDKLCLYSFHNYTQNPNIIYWIGDSEENNFFLEESLFKKILETPIIRFNISQKVKSRENDEFDVSTYVNISVEKIYSEFEGPLFNDFLNIIEVFIFDRGYSLAEEKSNQDFKKNDMAVYKISELENLIKSNYKSKTRNMTQKVIKFYLNQVELILAKVGKPLYQLLIKNFEGDHLIFFDNSSDTKMNIRDIQIKNIENKSNDILLSSSMHHENLGGLEDKIDMLVFRKRDSYTGIGTDSQWYTLDYVELYLRPLKINISKSQIEFFVDFFFKNNISELNEEQQRTMLLHSSKYRENSNVKKEETIVKKTEKKDDEEYPIYFKQFKINDTELILNFQYAEGSHFLV